MNDDELESLLRELPEPVLPGDWRGPVLATARREAWKDSRVGAANWPAMLLALARVARRNPVTVGGLAILWTLVLVLKAETPVDRDAERLMARAGSAPPPQIMPLREELLLAQMLQDESGPPPMQRP
jgi:hypothetical protein